MFQKSLFITIIILATTIVATSITLNVVTVSTIIVIVAVIIGCYLHKKQNLTSKLILYLYYSFLHKLLQHCVQEQLELHLRMWYQSVIILLTRWSLHYMYSKLSRPVTMVLLINVRILHKNKTMRM